MELKTMINLMNINHFSTYKKDLLPVLLAAAIFSPVVVTAGVYKWTDENGNVHYGSQRPADTTAERMNIDSGKQPYADPTATEEADKAGKKPGEENKENKKPQAAAAKAPEKQEISKKEKQARCAQARKNLQTISTRGRARVKQPDGTSRHVTDQERNANLAQVKKNVARYCK
jgi:hypothetical protein